MTNELSPEGRVERMLRDAYFDDNHYWVLPGQAETVRCGFDPLGVETSGDVVALSFEPIGTRLERGSAFGTIEAAKFVGPLISPVGGSILGHNEDLIAHPTALNEDPWRHWLVELALADREHGLAHLRHGEESVSAWLERETARFKEMGAIAE